MSDVEDDLFDDDAFDESFLEEDFFVDLKVKDLLLDEAYETEEEEGEDYFLDLDELDEYIGSINNDTILPTQQKADLEGPDTPIDSEIKKSPMSNFKGEVYETISPDAMMKMKGDEVKECIHYLMKELSIKEKHRFIKNLLPPSHQKGMLKSKDFIKFFHNYQNKRGQNGLMLAVLTGDMYFVKKLHQVQNEIDIVDNKGNSSLMYAISAKNYEMVSFLIDKGADPALVNSDGIDALYLSITKGQKFIFDYIVERSDNLNQIYKEGRTALMLAIKKGRIDFVKKLIQTGASLVSKDDYGKSILDYAEKSGNKKIEQLISNSLIEKI